MFICGVLSGSAPALSYIPAENRFGADSFTFRVNEGQADSGPATVAVRVTAVNDPSTAQGQSLATPEDTARVDQWGQTRMALT